MKLRIVDIAESDAYYEFKDQLIGKEIETFGNYSLDFSGSFEIPDGFIDPLYGKIYSGYAYCFILKQFERD